MDKQVQQYLLQYKYCPLPDIGILELQDGMAEARLGENKLLGPVPRILFSRKEKQADHFIKFIASERKVSIGEAGAQLEQYCQRLTRMDVFKEVKLGHLGKFFIDGTGKLVFQQTPLPPEFFPPVNLHRVIRRDAVHQVRVGDTETTNVAMTEYFSESGPMSGTKWWIAALVPAVIALAALAIYFNSPSSNNSMGNAIRVTPQAQTGTYKPVN
jgi:hypothetical protein